MTWPKPIVPPENKPTPPHFSRWFIGLMGCLIMANGLAYWFSYQADPDKAILYFLFFCIGSLFIWGVFLGWRLFIYGLQQDRFYAWETEKQRIDLSWNQWASRYLAVLDSHVILPNEITVQGFLTQPQTLPINMQRVVALEIDGEQGNRPLCVLNELLFAHYRLLADLPDQQCIIIEVIKANPFFSLSEHAIQTAWQQIGLPQQTQIILRNSLELSVIESLISAPDHHIRLFIFLQLENDGENRAFTASDWACSLLFVSPSLIDTGIVKPKARLYRPMLSHSDSVKHSLNQMHQIQRELASVRHLWLTGFQNKTASNLVGCLAELNLDLRLQAETRGVHSIDDTLGMPGKLNGWLALSLAVKAVEHTNEAQLAASYCGSRMTFNVLQPLP